MGVDPGLVATGFGVLEAGPGGVAVVDAGVISTGAGQVLEARLNAIYRAVHQLIEAHAPSLLIVEDLYTEYKFPRTAVLMGHARGVIYLAARQLEVPLLALTPSEVKRAITGNGAAGKAQVQRAVQTVLGLASAPHPSHIADALGLAVTGHGAADRAHSLGPGDRDAGRAAERPMIASCAVGSAASSRTGSSSRRPASATRSSSRPWSSARSPTRWRATGTGPTRCC